MAKGLLIEYVLEAFTGGFLPYGMESTVEIWLDLPDLGMVVIYLFGSFITHKHSLTIFKPDFDTYQLTIRRSRHPFFDHRSQWTQEQSKTRQDLSRHPQGYHQWTPETL